jgi:hypothetical protein
LHITQKFIHRSECIRHKYSFVTDLTQIANILQCNLAIVLEKKELNDDLLNKMTTIEIDKQYNAIIEILSDYNTTSIRPLVSIVGSFNVT